METWKDIPNYEGLYQVSNLGRIKSLYNYRRGNILTPSLKRGYYTIGLRKNGEAARQNGVKSTSSIMECCRGKITQTKGFVYRYEEVMPCR